MMVLLYNNSAFCSIYRSNKEDRGRERERRSHEDNGDQLARNPRSAHKSGTLPPTLYE
jgi:hypothetical protein